MTYTDEDLKKALRRREAPEDFTEKVLARVATQATAQTSSRRESWLNMLRQPLLRWAAAAAVSAALIGGGVHYRQLQSLKAQRERAEGEAAKQQLVLALRIAGSKLQLAKAKVNDINENEPKNRQVKE